MVYARWRILISICVCARAFNLNTLVKHAHTANSASNHLISEAKAPFSSSSPYEGQTILTQHTRMEGSGGNGLDVWQRISFGHEHIGIIVCRDVTIDPCHRLGCCYFLGFRVGLQNRIWYFEPKRPALSEVHHIGVRIVFTRVYIM